ncbi:mannitol dehydrogenase family protein [Thiospirochaeta perfilievii]|uniref:Mannitol dehydrogenase family protein n=1 Tax=Thiospirochaeta perfilievii TaxID=252967 RepID=A0A5C1QF37_9SPIO|nr:mannitol dehydrogenase family protein [Thiospirochaeta perfilievii]QEN05710.1 mannitol dehydrogenase family protein [Thiospirochaeta perfilievii]
MELSLNSLKDREVWENIDIKLPEFNIDEVVKNTENNPKWLHFGAGNIFKALICNRYQDLLDKKLVDTGIIAVESFDYEVIEAIYKKFDNLSVLVLTKADGSLEKRVVASVTDAITTRDSKLKEIFINPGLQIVSFTITEKGYGLYKPSGEYLDIIEDDIKNGLENPTHLMSIITSNLYNRYKNGGAPITVLSMDNCSHNGDKLKSAVLTIAVKWLKKSFVDQGFIDYIQDRSKVSFPLSMIDKITPRPSDVFKQDLEKSGLKSMDIVITSKGSYMAPFVNAEISEYLIIEDDFTNGRPELEAGGIIFTTRETVNSVETMKVTTCLNPLHTALAVTGCLLGYTLISDEMKDPLLKKLVETIGYNEGLKVVLDPGIINPKEFIDEVIYERFVNPYILDSPQRIATDTSQKVAIRFGETIKSYIKSETLNVSDLIGIPLAIASWLKYLTGIDDSGKTFTLSPDPELDVLKGKIKDVSGVKWILSNQKIFGLDLYMAGLGDKIEDMYNEMCSGIGGVRRCLKRYLDM